MAGTKISSLTAEVSTKDSEIDWLRDHQSVVVAPTSDPKIASILQQLQNDDRALKSEPKNILKKRALQISHDVLTYLAERDQVKPSDANFDHDSLEQLRQAENNYLQKYNVWWNETRQFYLLNYSLELISVLNEMKAQGIDTKSILSGGNDIRSLCQIAVNELVLSDCGSTVGTLAKQIR